MTKHMAGIARTVGVALIAMTCRIAGLVGAMVCSAGAAEPQNEPSGPGQPIKAIRAFYFGNSLTGCTDPQLHGSLVKPLGLSWEVKWNMGPGWQLWQHRRLVVAGQDLDTDNRGDLTLDKNFRAGAESVRKNFLEKSYDVMVLQPFEQSLSFYTEGLWGITFDEKMDVGDVACATALINLFLSKNPDGRVLIYQNWPNMKSGEVPPADQLPDWAKAPNARLVPAEFPDREAFDYEHEWLGKKYLNKHPDKPWLDQVRCQDYHRQLFEALKEKFPELWKSNRLQVIPVGDVWMALHKKAKAGQFDGISDIEEFYTDIQHSRIGLPRYSAAATFYTLLFNRAPHDLDWSVYNDTTNLKPDTYHDDGEHFTINDVRAKIVHDTIMEVVKSHPHTNVQSK